jgi:DNA-binding transcriptional regulator YiaG
MTKRQLRDLRRNTLHMTQLALADALGVRGMTVSRWETGWNPIPPLAATAITLLAEREAGRRSTSGRQTPSRRRRA